MDIFIIIAYVGILLSIICSFTVITYRAVLSYKIDYEIDETKEDNLKKISKYAMIIGGNLFIIGLLGKISQIFIQCSKINIVIFNTISVLYKSVTMTDLDAEFTGDEQEKEQFEIETELRNEQYPR